MSGNHSRNKGARTERKVVHAFQDAGIAAERVPLSGAAGGSYKGDISVPVLGEDRILEVKVRAAGFRELYRWLGDNYGLVVGADRQPLLMVVPLATWIENQRELERARSCLSP